MKLKKKLKLLTKIFNAVVVQKRKKDPQILVSIKMEKNWK